MTANVQTMAYRFADRADTPWHGLGVSVDRNEAVTAEEFQKRAGAAWTAEKKQLLYDPATSMHCDMIPSSAFALIRSDNGYELNVVSKQYQPVQNSEVFQFFHDFCTSGDMDIETGGVLDSGRTVWCLAGIREGFTLAGGDAVQGYLLFSNSHGGSAGRIKFTPIRVVCANTLAMAHSGSGSEFRIHHRTKFDATAAKSALGLGRHSLTQFKERAEFLATRRMDDPAFKRFLDVLFPADMTTTADNKIIEKRPRNYDKAIESLVTQAGAQLNRGTWWSGYNAITYMVDHMQNRADQGKALNNAWFGSGEKLKLQAFETALEMAK